MNRLLCLITLFLLMAGAAVSAELDIEQALSKKVSFNSDGLNFDKALVKISELTPFKPVPLESVMNAGMKNKALYLNVKDMPVSQLLDWFSAAINARYRILPDGRIYFSQNYEWVEVNKFGMLFIDMKAEVDNSQDLAQLDSVLAETAKIVSLFDDNYYIRIEEQADMVKLVAHIPRELKALFTEVVAAFSAEGTSFASEPAESDSELLSLISKISQVREVNYPYLPLNQILARLENDFGINIGCSNAVYSAGELMPEISLKLGEVSLREAVECVIEKTSLKGVEFSVPNGLWLTIYDADWTETVSRRFLWNDNVQIRSYDISELTLVIPGNVIAEQIYKSIAPRFWFDPLASVVYYKKRNTLIVVANGKTQKKICSALIELKARITGGK